MGPLMTFVWVYWKQIVRVGCKYIPGHYSRSKIEKVPRGIRGEKSSKDMASSRNLVLTTGALASPKMGDQTIKLHSYIYLMVHICKIA